ncbi:MAG: phospholipase [Candidatus Cloacimonetes bacterium]|nr:phospholipase [Candidatus Cloacimonadota bacterium]
MNTDPHRDQPVRTAGRDIADAAAVMILIHGRGATAESILQLAAELDRDDFAYLAPQAAGFTWYPQSFLAPIEENEPYLSSALSFVRSVVDRVLESGIPSERLMLLGFSQGACLTTELTARNPRRYGGIVALTGGLIGPDGTPRDYPGSLDGTPVFLGSSDPDFHIPVERVHETERVLTGMGAVVTKRIYPGMGHTVNEDEIAHVRRMMADVVGERG